MEKGGKFIPLLCFSVNWYKCKCVCACICVHMCVCVHVCVMSACHRVSSFPFTAPWQQCQTRPHMICVCLWEYVCVCVWVDGVFILPPNPFHPTSLGCSEVLTNGQSRPTKPAFGSAMSWTRSYSPLLLMGPDCADLWAGFLGEEPRRRGKRRAGEASLLLMLTSPTTPDDLQKERGG